MKLKTIDQLKLIQFDILNILYCSTLKWAFTILAPTIPFATPWITPLYTVYSALHIAYTGTTLWYDITYSTLHTVKMRVL